MDDEKVARKGITRRERKNIVKDACPRFEIMMGDS